LRDRFLGKDIIDEREVRLVGVRRCVIVRDERWGTTSAVGLRNEESKTRQGEG